MQDRHSSSNSSSSSKGKRLQQPAAAAAPSFLIPSLCSCCSLHFVPGLQCPIKCAATRREWLCSLRFSTSGSAVYCAAAGGRGKAGPRAVCSVLCREGWPRAGSTDSGSSLTGGCLHQLSTRSPAAFSFSTSFPLKFPRLPATGHTLFSSH